MDTATKPMPARINTAIHPLVYKRLTEVADSEGRKIVAQLHLTLCEALDLPELRQEIPSTGIKKAEYRARVAAKKPKRKRDAS